MAHVRHHVESAYTPLQCRSEGSSASRSAHVDRPDSGFLLFYFFFSFFSSKIWTISKFKLVFLKYEQISILNKIWNLKFFAQIQNMNNFEFVQTQNMNKIQCEQNSNFKQFLQLNNF
jgi:hypothetical protein